MSGLPAHFMKWRIKKACRKCFRQACVFDIRSWSDHFRWPVLWYVSIFLVLFSHRRYKCSWLYIFFLPKFILNNLWKILPKTCCVNKKLTAMQYHAQGTKTFRRWFSGHKGEANEGGWMENTFVPWLCHPASRTQPELVVATIVFRRQQFP